MCMSWWEGTYKQKIARVAISYFLMIPSWFLQYNLIELLKINFLTTFVINEFFLNAAHFTIILYLQFGFVPFYILRRLKLTSSFENMNYNYIGS